MTMFQTLPGSTGGHVWDVEGSGYRDLGLGITYGLGFRFRFRVQLWVQSLGLRG